MIFTSAPTNADAEESSAVVRTGAGEGVGEETVFATDSAGVLTGEVVAAFFFEMKVAIGEEIVALFSLAGEGERLGTEEKVAEVECVFVVGEGGIV